MGKTWGLLSWTLPKFKFFSSVKESQFSFPFLKDYESIQPSVQSPPRKILRLIFLVSADKLESWQAVLKYCILLSSLTVPPTDPLNPLWFLKSLLEYFTEFSVKMFILVRYSPITCTQVTLEENMLKEAMTQHTFLMYCWKLPKQVTYMSKSSYSSIFNWINLNSSLNN